MMLIVLLNIYIGYAIAAIYKQIDNISKSKIQVILEEESPSLLSCTNKCLHHKAQVNFNAPYCRCFIIKKDGLKEGGGVETLSGSFCQRTYLKTVTSEKGISGRLCKFTVGDGNGGAEIHVDNVLTGDACVKECIRRKNADSSLNINGVTVFADTNKGGCWCEQGMTGRVNTQVAYQSCFIDTSNNCPFVLGDGNGGAEIHVDNVSTGDACVKECIRRKNADSSLNINGVTVFADTNKGGCWCEQGMTGRVKVHQSCYI